MVMTPKDIFYCAVQPQKSHRNNLCSTKEDIYNCAKIQILILDSSFSEIVKVLQSTQNIFFHLFLSCLAKSENLVFYGNCFTDLKKKLSVLFYYLESR